MSRIISLWFWIGYVVGISSKSIMCSHHCLGMIFQVVVASMLIATSSAKSVDSGYLDNNNDEYNDVKEYSYYDEGDHSGPPPASRNATQEPIKLVAEELHEMKHLTKNILDKVNANRENLKALNARINNMEKQAKSKYLTCSLQSVAK